MCPCPSLWNRKVLQMATLAKRTRVLWLLCNLELFKGYCTHCRLEHWFSASGSGSGGHTHIHMHNTFFNLEVPVEVAAECQPDFFCFWRGVVLQKVWETLQLQGSNWKKVECLLEVLCPASQRPSNSSSPCLLGRWRRCCQVCLFTRPGTFDPVIFVSHWWGACKQGR